MEFKFGTNPREHHVYLFTPDDEIWLGTIDRHTYVFTPNTHLDMPEWLVKKMIKFVQTQS